ncbi:MAG: hypothetical protein KKG47_00365 [Proteobacteria bacterium]|nr:hypothetical protein [Pseudomonadota bacterium]MBU1737191.1 hypothetical protein [Pseudomonadota bacterium]
MASNTSVLTTTVDATTAAQNIQEDTFIINNREVGRIDGAAAVNGLAMGKTYNAVNAINAPVLGVTAKMTTLVAGAAVTPLGAPPLNDGEVISFEINGVAVNYTVDNDGVGTDDSDALPATTFATNVVNAINAAISAYNASVANPTDVTITAAVGDGTNGGVLNSIVLRNTNAGDESNIIIANLLSTPASGIEANLGLTAGTYNADATHNTGEITLFSHEPYEVEGGIDDRFLDQLGMGGGLHVNDPGGDGRFTWSFTEGGIINSLQGYKYADELQTDGGSIEIWLYNKNGTLALPQPVSISMDRVVTLQDVAESINVSITNASGGASWLTASVYQNQLRLTPDVNHDFAFGTDNSNMLQVAGINTFFTGYSAGTLEVNEDVVNNLDLIAAARVNEFGEIFKGDNTNALEITKIQRAQDVTFTGGTTGNLDGFYNSLISAVGSKGRTVNTEYEFNEMVSNQLAAMRDDVSGVSLDEEMANLVKFQHAYSAAARLITISDEMLLALINTVNR